MSDKKSTKYAIKSGLLIDGTGNTPLHDVFVVINNGKIDSISKRVDSSLEVLDAGNLTVMPGMIDSHLHIAGHWTDKFVEETIVRPTELLLIKAIYDIQDLLDAGFTTVRDCGGTKVPIFEWRLKPG
jgi:imidazolonepropionase-like amidohydrolase